MKPPSDKNLTAVGPIPIGERKTMRLEIQPVSLPIEIGSFPVLIIDIDAQTDEPYEYETQVYGCTKLVTCICADCLLGSLAEVKYG
jgi:hypothetical protein